MRKAQEVYNALYKISNYPARQKLIDLLIRKHINNIFIFTWTDIRHHHD